MWKSETISSLVLSTQVLWRTWLDQTTGCQTRTSPSATSAPKPSLQPCPSTTAGPVDRACADPAPHTSGLCLPEAGTTQSECATAATTAQTACEFERAGDTSPTVHSRLGLPVMIHEEKKKNHCESWYCQEEVVMGGLGGWVGGGVNFNSSNRQNWNQPSVFACKVKSSLFKVIPTWIPDFNQRWSRIWFPSHLPSLTNQQDSASIQTAATGQMDIWTSVLNLTWWL